MLDGEHKIIKRAQKGNSECFGLLYDHYVPQIYRFIFLKVSHKQEAEDLTHEVFLKAWQNIDSFDYRGLPFSSWLYEMARNRIIDHYRTRKENISLENADENMFKVVTAIDQQIDQAVTIEKIKAAIQKLNEDQQNVIILRFVEDFSPAEIAAITNKSEGAVRLMQYRAVKNLKEILENGDTNN